MTLNKKAHHFLKFLKSCINNIKTSPDVTVSQQVPATNECNQVSNRINIVCLKWAAKLNISLCRTRCVCYRIIGLV